ncbi:MAG: hypothetical protein KC635_29055, partial [Myxococcales bacterium]|nr:hypothetical protein [Myxococcales bacterium]
MVAPFRSRLLAAAALLALLAPAGAARAKSWCAYPLWAHEWGVQVFDGGGAPKPGGGLPAWFHHATAGGTSATPVRALPRDSGERDLPVLHFYTPGGGGVAVGLEVGFAHGAATAWYPDVDALRPAAEANSKGAATAREALLAARQVPPGERAPGVLPADPTRQLVWERLDLAAAAPAPPRKTGAAWVLGARALDGALWATAHGESERFVFYEAKTAEKAPLALSRGPRWTAARRELVLENTGAATLHDVTLVHREGGRAFLVTFARLDKGARATFVLDDFAAADPRAAAEAQARAAWVDPADPKPDMAWSWDFDHCVMMRDPAVPVEAAADHRLYRAEVDLV